jgi:hypothetical protein
MKATLMGTDVSATFFLTAAVLIAIAQIATWEFARRAGLIEVAPRVMWTKGRVLACVSMVLLSFVALAFGFLAFVTSFVERWQALWPIATILVLAGFIGFAIAPRFLFR